MIDTSKPVDRTGNTFCGPLVVAAICGTSTGQVCESIAAMRQRTGGVQLGKRVKRVRARTADKIKGTYDGELFAVLKSQGFAVAPVDVGARYRSQSVRGFYRDTFVSDDGKRFCRGAPPILDSRTWWPWTLIERECLPLWRWLLRVRDDAHTYIVHLPGHWAIAHAGQWCETYTDGKWVPANRAPRGSRKVINAWRVTRAGSYVS